MKSQWFGMDFQINLRKTFNFNLKIISTDKIFGKKIHRLSIFFQNYTVIKNYMTIILVKQTCKIKNAKTIQTFYYCAYCNQAILLMGFLFLPKSFKGISCSFSSSNHSQTLLNKKIKRLLTIIKITSMIVKKSIKK